MKIIKGGCCAPLGFRANGILCGIKKNKKDLALIFSVVPAAASGVFTKNKFAAAPVLISKERLNNLKAQAIIANSGTANCCTGKKGYKDAQEVTKSIAKLLNIEEENVLPASTGVIGAPLPLNKIKQKAKVLIEGLSRNASLHAAEAIMTTDRFVKEAALEVVISGKKVKIGGIAKGAGMIEPDMATMLCFLTTDALIEPFALKKALKEAVADSFNSITVDGDTSTNDTVIILANGLAGNKKIKEDTQQYKQFTDALKFLTDHLSYLMVKDGEGATKVVEIKIDGAKTKEDARKVGKRIANSLLVKTAMYGCDPNWGRIAAAVGSSGVEFSPDKVNITIGGKVVFKNGNPVSFNKAKLKNILNKEKVEIGVELGAGENSAIVRTCDLTEKYIRINAHYTT